jgi:hypothetical protein
MEAMPVVNIMQEAAVKFLQSIIYRFRVPRRVLTDNGTWFKGEKFVRWCTDFGIHHQLSSATHPQTNRKVERANMLILWVIKTRMFHDLEARGRNWHSELPSVLWALHTNINKATRDTPFNMVYGVDAVVPPEIYLESVRVAHFNVESQAEARDLDSNLLEEKRNTALVNVRKYQESLKWYYNKSVVQRELNIGDLVLKKDIRTKDKHKFSSPWEGSFIIVDIAALGAYVLAKVDVSMLPNMWNVNQLRKYYAWYIYLINKDTMFFILHLLVYYIIFRFIDRRGSSAQQQKW